MATRAVVMRTDLERNHENPAQLNMAVTAVILGEIGAYGGPDVKTLVSNVDVANDANMKNQIAAAIKTELEANGVVFIASDSVLVL
jgi:hypothetical protein